jgi:hypothetical protein
LLNAGSTSHVGPNRMYVELARELAVAGTLVCRADLSGIGDSPVRVDARENDPYPAGSVDDIAQLLAAIDERYGPRPLALAGICSGAWASLHSALTCQGIDEIVLINADFYGERSVFGKPADLIRPKDYARLKRSVRDSAKWRKLLRGEVNIMRVARILFSQLRARFSLARRRARGDEEALDRDLGLLAERGIRVSFVFSPGDGAEDYLAAHGSKGRSVLDGAGLLRERTIEGADHTFTPPRARREFLDTLGNWFSR